MGDSVGRSYTHCKWTSTRWCGFESLLWVSGFKSFSCVSTIFVIINIDCQLNRIRVTMETSSSMCLGRSFLIALIEVERPIHHQYELHHSTEQEVCVKAKSHFSPVPDCGCKRTCCHSFTVLVSCTLKPWAKINTSFFKLPSILSC